MLTWIVSISILVLASKHEIEIRNSRSRLEARDWKKKNLVFVSSMRLKERNSRSRFENWNSLLVTHFSQAHFNQIETIQIVSEEEEEKIEKNLTSHFSTFPGDSSPKASDSLKCLSCQPGGKGFDDHAHHHWWSWSSSWRWLWGSCQWLRWRCQF